MTSTYFVTYLILLLSLALTGLSLRSRGIARRENQALNRVVRSRLVVLRNPDGGNGGPGYRIVDDTFESLYLLAKYGGMMATEGHEYAINTAYGTMTVAIDMPEE